MREPVRTILLNAVTGTGQGTTTIGSGGGRPPTFDASLTGSGALTATVLILARNTSGGVWSTIATLSLSGTGSAAQAYQAVGCFVEYAANMTAVSGTGATVTCTMAD